MRRRLGIGVGGIAIVFAITTAAVAVDAPAFVDGRWEGILVYKGHASYTAAEASGGVVAGSFTLDSSSGSVSAGAFAVAGTGEGAAEGGGFAQLVIAWEGTVIGPAAAPILDPTGGRVTGTAGAEGIIVPVDFALAASEIVPITLEIHSASCNFANGDWTQEAAALVASAGGTLTVITGWWTATRVGESSTPPSTQQAIAELIEAADLFEAGMAEGHIPTSEEFGELLAAAEQLADSVTRAADCGLPAGAFTTFVTSVMIKILETMAANPDVFDALAWQSAVLTGVRAGAIGSGSTNPNAAQLESEILQIAADLLNDAVSSGDTGAMMQVAVIALTLGDTSLADAAEKAYQDATT
jgi:hypothetical protein